MEKRILVTVRGEGCVEKALAVESGLRRMLASDGISGVSICLQEELKVFPFVNDVYCADAEGGRKGGRKNPYNICDCEKPAVAYDE
ncbi:MAG: hypothetical protein NC548_38750 [Lachnospiraceae bacterium]|nr:hypothetical protein [Lachnospiraceae bacterium]